MARKNKNHPSPSHDDSNCEACIEALSIYMHEHNPATKAMLKEKAHQTCNSCSHYKPINSKKK